MSTTFVKKNIKLSLEFDKYLTRNPRALNKIPQGGWIFITVKGDKEFNRTSRNLIQQTRTNSKKIVEAQKEGSRWTIQSFVAVQ
jgi:hypothetical protein